MTTAEDYVHHVHVRLAFNSRQIGDYSLLLQGTKAQIAKSVSNAVMSGLDNGATKITLIPVKPHEVWDLEKNPPS